MIYLLWHGWGGGIFCENLINEAMQQGKRYHYESGGAKKDKKAKKRSGLKPPSCPFGDAPVQ